jgi:hypothetical protein
MGINKLNFEKNIRRVGVAGLKLYFGEEISQDEKEWLGEILIKIYMGSKYTPDELFEIKPPTGINKASAFEADKLSLAFARIAELHDGYDPNTNYPTAINQAANEFNFPAQTLQARWGDTTRANLRSPIRHLEIHQLLKKYL